MRIIFTLLFALAAYYGWTHRSGHSGATADLSTAQIQTLAASVKAEEVVMYSTTECPYCFAAKGWCYLLIYDRIFYLFSIIAKIKNQGVFTTFAS